MYSGKKELERDQGRQVAGRGASDSTPDVRDTVPAAERPDLTFRPPVRCGVRHPFGILAP